MMAYITLEEQEEATYEVLAGPSRRSQHRPSCAHSVRIDLLNVNSHTGGFFKRGEKGEVNQKRAGGGHSMKTTTS